MINPPVKSDKRKVSDMIPGFWKLLPLFWDKKRVTKWRRAIFPDSENPDVGAEGCFNLISLTATAHEMWNKGVFALKPLKLSHDQKELTVQFFWQVSGNYEVDDQVDLLTEPTSSEGLDLLPNGSFLPRIDNGSNLRIQSGETFTFTTKDPKNLPLPSLDLLEMQWVLQRLVGMSGAAGWPSLDSFDDDTIDNDDSLPIPDNIEYIVRGWRDTEDAGITPETSTATPGPPAIECHLNGPEWTPAG
jgi:hypothetical protein